MSLIFGLIRKNPLSSLLLVLVAAQGLAYWWQGLALEDAQQDLATCAVERAAAAAALKEQNRAVADLQAVGDKQQSEILEARAVADRARGEYLALARSIQGDSVPRECEAAVGWAREKTGELLDAWRDK